MKEGTYKSELRLKNKVILFHLDKSAMILNGSILDLYIPDVSLYRISVVNKAFGLNYLETKKSAEI